jgi:ribosomal protein L40E
MTMTAMQSMRRRLRGASPQEEHAAAEQAARSELRAQRDALAERVAELTFDLGGLTYEMAIRDHFRVDVLVRRAAELQAADAELGEVERLLAIEETAVTGACRSCGAPHSRGAVYCWKCGQPLVLRMPATAALSDGGASAA